MGAYKRRKDLFSFSSQDGDRDWPSWVEMTNDTTVIWNIHGFVEILSSNICCKESVISYQYRTEIYAITPNDTICHDILVTFVEERPALE